jgi:hypothetical protein
VSEFDEGGCGVCLGGYDSDGTLEMYREKIVTARKSHQCYECEREIKPGEKYERVTGRWEDEWIVYDFCLICSEISTCLSCNGRCFGNLWKDVRDNLFPDMTTGCLAKLKTAAAKEYLVNKWREWKGYFSA